MTMSAPRNDIVLSFEFFPPKNADMESEILRTAGRLAAYAPDFVSVTYGAGGSTRETSLNTVARLIAETGLDVAAHLTCVAATREEVDRVAAAYLAAGCSRFVALRGDPQGGVGTAYAPHPNGYVNAADLCSGLSRLGVSDISVSAYPEKHPESADRAADLAMLRQKAENGACRAITQFFFDNDLFEAYRADVDAAGIAIEIVPGILPIHNLAQVRRFAAACGASVPDVVIAALEPVDHDPVARAAVAAELAGRQIADLRRRGVKRFHLYTMNRAPLIEASLDAAGIAPLARRPVTLSAAALAAE